MIIHVRKNECDYVVDLSKPIDISIPLKEGTETVNAFWAPYLQIEPVREGSFVGDVGLGGVVNFKNVRLNPHGNGTHTECVGHITAQNYTLNACMQQFFFVAELVSVYPQKEQNGDRIITQAILEMAVAGKKLPEALIIRTLPNDDLKMSVNYSGSNPPYLAAAAVEWLVAQGVAHLLIDLPSVDKEVDGGQLAAHKAFWQYPNHAQTRLHCTISELIYVPNQVADGTYLLNIMVTSLELDASPSKPILYTFI